MFSSSSSTTTLCHFRWSRGELTTEAIAEYRWEGCEPTVKDRNTNSSIVVLKGKRHMGGARPMAYQYGIFDAARMVECTDDDDLSPPKPDHSFPGERAPLVVPESS